MNYKYVEEPVPISFGPTAQCTQVLNRQITYVYRNMVLRINRFYNGVLEATTQEGIDLKLSSTCADELIPISRTVRYNLYKTKGGLPC